MIVIMIVIIMILVIMIILIKLILLILASRQVPKQISESGRGALPQDPLSGGQGAKQEQ